MELDMNKRQAYKEGDTLWIVNEKEYTAYETTERQPGPNDIFICHDMMYRHGTALLEKKRYGINVEVPQRFITKLLSINE